MCRHNVLKYDNSVAILYVLVFDQKDRVVSLPERLNKVQIGELVQLHKRVQHLDVEIISVEQNN